MSELIDRICYGFVCSMIGAHLLALVYYFKSALGIDLLEGHFLLHDLFFT